MAFTSLTFLFLYLPVALAIYYLIPNQLLKVKNIVLVILSLLFYAWGDITYLPLLVVSVIFNFASAKLLTSVEADRNSLRRRGILISAIGIDLVILAIFKYSGLSQPVGISFYTFSAISYLVDVYRTDVTAGDFWTDACYITFFPKLVSGPIITYKEMKQQIEERRISRSDLLIGVHLFVIGLFKKVLLADNLGVAFGQVYGLEQMAGATAWLGMIFYGLQLYFDFSGYSDMAIGLARIFGFKVDKNFDYPYTSESVSVFWRKWHISLGSWFRNYVYIPLGGNRCSKNEQIRNLAVVWILTGIWHGNTWNYVLWGIYHGVIILIEKFVIGEKREVIPRGLRILITDLLVFFGWIFFFNPTLGSSLGYIGRLFGADGVGFINSATIYYLTGNLILLLAALIGCFPWVDHLYKNIVYKKGKGFYAALAIHVVLFLFCIANMVGSTYQTFMYFKF